MPHCIMCGRYFAIGGWTHAECKECRHRHYGYGLGGGPGVVVIDSMGPGYGGYAPPYGGVGVNVGMGAYGGGYPGATTITTTTQGGYGTPMMTPPMMGAPVVYPGGASYTTTTYGAPTYY